MVGVAVMAALWVVVAALNSSETTPTVQQIEQERSERKVFTTTRLEVGIRTILTEQYQIEGVESVSCPPAQDVVVGHTFQCVAVIHGEHRAVPIRVTSDEGHYEVGKPA